MEIKNSVAIVTGASGGIGLAVARALSEKGAKVVLAARSADTLAKLEKEIPNSLAVTADMTKPQDIAALVQKAKGAFGRVDILVNNAGQGMRASVEAMHMDDYRSIMELNVFSIAEAMQAVIPIMRAQGKGLILNVSSMLSKMIVPNLAAYSSTKYALNCLSLTAREELAGDGIAVCIFLPKMTATNFGKNARGEKYSSSAGRPGMAVDTPEAVAEAMVRQIESEEAEAGM